MREQFTGYLDWLTDHPVLTAALLASLAAGGAAVLTLFTGIPAPGGADEYSYLLAADTFASGRIANPPHPFWQHFETFHVLQQPTYVSKYPPAQGLVLGLGQALGGHPVVGVWLSVGLMVASMYWMFNVWLPARWALAGGMLVVLQLGVSSYWAQSYWGGAVAATGGALVFGATRRLSERPSAGIAVVLGVGLAILANSRPFEGLVVSLFAAAALGWHFIRNDGSYRRRFLSRVAAPAGAILLLTGLAMGYYNLRTTGDPLYMPYQAYASSYSMGSFIPWREPSLNDGLRHEIMREYAIEWGQQRLSVLRDPGSFVLLGLTRTAHRMWFFLGVFSIVGIVGLRRSLSSGWFAFGALVVSTVWGLSLFTTAYPHYVAPGVALVVVIAVESCRCLVGSRRIIGPGRLLVHVAVVLELAFFATGLFRPQYLTTRASPVKQAFVDSRSNIVDRLNASPGPDLVIVKYGPGHSFHREWVYNRADVDSAEIVWARDMGESNNQDLIAHFAGWSIWRLGARGRSDASDANQGEQIILRPDSEVPHDKR